MRRIILIVLFVIVPQTLPAYESGMLNLKTPTGLERGKGEFKVQHRFKGKVSEEPFDNFFGMDLAGVNVGIGLRYTVWSELELNASRIWDGKEYTVGVGYAYSFPKTPLRGQVDGQFFSYEEFSLEKGSEERESSFFGLLSLQSEPAFGRVTPVVNIGYDIHNEEFGAGLGLGIAAFENLGIVRKLSVIGEYFPTTGGTESEKSFAFGLRVETYGHHFDLILHNNWGMGVRRLMSGTTITEGLHFGFNIKRLLGH
jgi:hypothetical protein